MQDPLFPIPKFYAHFHAPCRLQAGDVQGGGVAFDACLGHFELSFIVVLGSVAFRALQVPGFDLEFAALREWVAKGEDVLAFAGFGLDGHVGGFAGLADAVETTVRPLGTCPCVHPGCVELAVFRVESAAVDAGGEFADGKGAWPACLDFPKYS